MNEEHKLKITANLSDRLCELTISYLKEHVNPDDFLMGEALDIISASHYNSMFNGLRFMADCVDQNCPEVKKEVERFIESTMDNLASNKDFPLKTCVSKDLENDD